MKEIKYTFELWLRILPYVLLIPVGIGLIHLGLLIFCIEFGCSMKLLTGVILFGSLLIAIGMKIFYRFKLWYKGYKNKKKWKDNNNGR